MKQETEKIGGVTVPAGLEKADLLKFLVQNKSLLMKEKKSTIKRADAVSAGIDLTSKFSVDKSGNLVKAATAGQSLVTDTAFCVINTTNWYDSHGDVHMPGIWAKSLRDNNVMLHLQEHEMSFAAVISDEAKGYTERLAWKDVGLDAQGMTEALIFATPLNGRNAYMDEQYRKGYVKNHSVGMRYVSLKLCINEPDSDYYKEEYANWVQYAPQVINLSDAESDGFFWAVLDAKIIEGSAVVKGSNIITPTINIQSASTKGEPQDSTLTTPQDSGFLDWLSKAQLVTN